MQSKPHAGFTLIEVLIVVAMIGLVTAALAAAITVFARNEGSVSTRLTDTRDLQSLTNYLPGDVASAQLVESDLTGNSVDAVTDTLSLCGSGGDVLLHLEWAENWQEDYSAEITYRLLPPSASDPEQVVRFECENLAAPSEIKIAESFDTVGIVLQRDGADLTGTVEIMFTYADGETKRVTATSRHFLP